MSSDINNQFLHRISVVEDEILRNPCVDDASFEAFNIRWVTLVDDIKAAIDAELLSSFTITTAHVLAERVAFMVQTFWDLDVLSQKLMASLLDETLTSPDRSHDTPTKTDIPQSFPLYIKLSYDWLLDNIHNPYPSACVRDAIAQTSGATRKDVDNWFIDARKRIGWNDARKAYFSNKRANIVDVATRFYANDEKLSLNPGAEYAFVSIVKNAKDLYCDKLNRTALATKLDAVVKDLTPETKAEAKAERMRQLQLKKDRDSYPSPDHSPQPTRSSTLSCDDEDETVTIPIFIHNRKRRTLSVEPVALVQNEECGPGKHSRHLESSIFHIASRPSNHRLEEASTSSPKGVMFPISLPSPPSSVDESLEVTKPINLPSPPSASVSRKRRLSEADGEIVPKRPRHLSIGSRPQTVSDPLPLSSEVLFDETSFRGWFQQGFERPEVGEISPGFSVELANLADFNCETSIESRSTSSSEISEQKFEPRTIVEADLLGPAMLDLPWNELDFDWTDLSLSPENLRQLANLMGEEFVPKLLVEDLANLQTSSQASHTANELESLFSLSNPSIVDPNPSIVDPASSETWDLSGSTLSRDDASIRGKSNTDFEINNGLFASFDLPHGVDFLSSPDTFLLPALSQDGKLRQEKENEFREACEKAQRLALELQEDDFFI